MQMKMMVPPCVVYMHTGDFNILKLYQDLELGSCFYYGATLQSTYQLFQLLQKKANGLGGDLQPRPT